ncbi:hypothetical protein M3210_03100 [Oceanobacillus luteolus]|uniref:hypothetical protein n=1 Tax=Oceanobacillus luteolus TaxID=1274358 RepID=UPI0020410C1D|nr:hypothetical protein [Oceanobacillus luteolus]MCM3739251.1 hypothetical protein [Oceanobacillus luteolus]
MSDPQNNIGKICKSLEKYFDAGAGRVRVKSRPVLIIGCEQNYTSPSDVDYEILPISKIDNFEPDEDFDVLLDEEDIQELSLHQVSYIRTHKTTWNHCRHMRVEDPIGDLKSTFPEKFDEIILKNHEWVLSRTNRVVSKKIKVEISEEEYIDDLSF